MEDDRFSDYDTAIEILSRLPIESIAELKRTSKGWLQLFSDPSFINAHFQHSAVRTFSGLFVQGIAYCRGCKNYVDFPEVDFISMQEEKGCHKLNRNMLDFLPEKVSVITSCNGILLCRSFFEMIYEDHCHQLKGSKDVPMEIVLYVCNPLTKEWISFKPEGKYQKRCCFGFAYDPYGSALVNPTKIYPTFQVVMVQPPSQLGKYPYLFRVYSSETKTWRTSKEVCYLQKILHPHEGFFANGVCYWRTLGHSILAFDLKHERSQVIKLPGPEFKEEESEGMCLGLSEGDLHFVSINEYGLMIWVLKHDMPQYEWVLKHSKPAREMKHHSYDVVDMLYLKPYVFRDKIVFIEVHWTMCTYNIKTGLIEEDLYNMLELDNKTFPTPIVIPYYKSLLRVQACDDKEGVLSHTRITR